MNGISRMVADGTQTSGNRTGEQDDEGSEEGLETGRYQVRRL